MSKEPIGEIGGIPIGHVMDLPPGVCDKCGSFVPPSNNMVNLLTELGASRFSAMFILSRHILPVVIDGEVVCEGSPSRAQYLDGQPLDARADYPLDPSFVKTMREAYERMQEKYPAEDD